MFRKLISSFSILLFFVTASAVGQVQVGYMNTQEVLSQIPERAEIEQQMNDFIESRRTEFQERTRSFQDAVAEYQQNQDSMSEAERSRQEEQLAQMEQELNQYQQQMQQQIQQRRAELLQPIYDRMDKAIASIAEEMNLDFVLNEATNMGEEVIFFASDEKLNITQQVIERVKN